MAHWLMKSEPTTYSFDDLSREPARSTCWEGVRNYQARSMMRDKMKVGDRAFFYHSSCDEPGIVGIVEVVREGYPDPTAFDPAARYYDAKSDPDNPRWYMVDVRHVRPMKRTITLAELKAEPALADFALVQRGNRLSVMPLTAGQWKRILALE